MHDMEASRMEALRGVGHCVHSGLLDFGRLKNRWCSLRLQVLPSPRGNRLRRDSRGSPLRQGFRGSRDLQDLQDLQVRPGLRVLLGTQDRPTTAYPTTAYPTMAGPTTACPTTAGPTTVGPNPTVPATARCTSQTEHSIRRACSIRLEHSNRQACSIRRCRTP